MSAEAAKGNATRDVKEFELALLEPDGSLSFFAREGK